MGIDVPRLEPILVDSRGRERTLTMPEASCRTAMGSEMVTTVVQSLLFGLSPTDPVTFLMAAVVMMSIACAAVFFPARQAARIDPMVALRTE